MDKYYSRCKIRDECAGPVETLGLPVTFTATPGGPKSGAPLYGEHTREILAEHGLSQAEIETLLRDGVVAAAFAVP